ncbi:MAG: anthranilate synthase component I family protein [Bacteroidota bacterium]|nr:anthranilate synthase component I family protein [Bacteroidota bacterium]
MNAERFPDREQLYSLIRNASDSFTKVIVLNGNNYSNYPYGSFPTYLAAGNQIFTQNGNLSDLQKFIFNNSGIKFGFLGYDLKNEIEAISSNNFDGVLLPNFGFLVPEIFIDFTTVNPINNLKNSFKWTDYNTFQTKFKGEIKSRVTKKDYIKTVNLIQERIQNGEVYEMNFCIEFYIEDIDIDPVGLYTLLNSSAPMPFSAFMKWDNHYLICASPERFLKKDRNKLISQPIKGTAPRSKDLKKDELIKTQLQHSEKEIAENTMIVDLVRNDLTKCATDGSVNLYELCKVYSFPNVHQMISTVVAESKHDITFTDIIKSSFPMGSMTGAPKYAAMKYIEQYEHTKRGLYSGAIGYIDENGNFDFNVVIRSVIYNASAKYLSFQVGSAITIDANPEQEYEECLVKAKAIFELFG